MGKNKRKQIEVENKLGKFSVDSNEEVAFLNWCEEAIINGLIQIDPGYFYQPETFMLFEGYKPIINGKTRTKLREHVYSPDFAIILTDELIQKCPKAIEKLFWKSDNKEHDYVYIDIKGTFNQTQRSFSVDQKWMLEKHNVFVNKIIPEDLFELTWVPEKERYSPKKHQLRDKYKDFKTIDQLMQNAGAD